MENCNIFQQIIIYNFEIMRLLLYIFQVLHSQSKYTFLPIGIVNTFELHLNNYVSKDA